MSRKCDRHGMLSESGAEPSRTRQDQKRRVAPGLFPPQETKCTIYQPGVKNQRR